MGKAPEPKADAGVAAAPKPKKCFVMMPISDVEGYPVGHFNEVYKQLIEPAVTAAGYICELATSTSAAHMIQLEVVTRVATADLCICDLSTNNPNVLFEYGIRQAFDKPTVLIKDEITRRIFDISGFRDVEYDHSLRIAATLAARERITTAIRETVDALADGTQIFSLIKLMNLVQAASLPSTDGVNRDDARFQLLEQKLEGLSSQLDSRPRFRASREVAVALAGPPRTETFDLGNYTLTASTSGLIYQDKGAGFGELFERSTDLADKPWWAFLDENDRIKILNAVRSKRGILGF